MEISKFIQAKRLAAFGGLEKGMNPGELDAETFVNDRDAIMRLKLREYQTWYTGDGDELLKLYNKENTIDFNTEMWYWKNKRSYYWAVSSTESDVKRTHSGLPRNIVDTLVAIIGEPTVKMDDEGMNKELTDILDSCSFWDKYREEQLPMTLVEGWGAYKIDWDKRFSDRPYVTYMRAENVEFLERNGMTFGMIFKTWYENAKGERFLILETRSLQPSEDGGKADLLIETKAYRASGDPDDESLSEIGLDSMPSLKGVEDRILVKNVGNLLAQRCVFYRDPDGLPGRSVYSGKIDIFDDLDQCWSQASNSVRRSTVQEYFDTNFLERDPKTGMLKQPKSFDRKYTMVTGGRTADGTLAGASAVQVSQPQVNFTQYNEEAVQIMINCVSGVLSPATLGIDVAKKDNAEAQREKEKITIFTRNWVIRKENDILKGLFSMLLTAQNLMRDESSAPVVSKSEISIKFGEFADDSYESKLRVLGDALMGGAISPDLFLDKLYGDTLSAADRERELEFLKAKFSPAPMGPDSMFGQRIDDNEAQLLGLKPGPMDGQPVMGEPRAFTNDGPLSEVLKETGQADSDGHLKSEIPQAELPPMPK